MSYRYDIFLSYRRADPVGGWVRRHFLPRLREWMTTDLGREAEIFVDVDGIEDGDAWPYRLQEALRDSRVLVPIWEPAYFSRAWCRAEMSCMRDREELHGFRTTERPQGLIFPVLFHDGDRFAEALQFATCRDLRELTCSSGDAAFGRSRKALKLTDQVKEFASEIAGVLPQVPDWSSDLPPLVERVWPSPRPPEIAEVLMSGHLITCYSYKGGVGRTMALANMAVLMAQRGRRVLCVDWDLEAPGLHLYFQEERALAAPGATGLLDLVEALAVEAGADWRPYRRPVALSASGRLDLICAGAEASGYVARLQKLNWESLYSDFKIGSAIERLRGEWAAEYDVVLIDSRTGISDIGGICTIQLPDILVMFFTANEQSFRGSLEMAARVQAGRQQLAWPRAALRILPVPSRFEGRVEYDSAQKWLARFATELEPLYDGWLHQDVSPQEILRFTRLPAVPHWGFGEQLPILQEDRKDPETLAYAYESLGVLLEKGLENSKELVDRRLDFLEPAGLPETVEIAFLGEVDEYVRKVVGYLREAGIAVAVWSDHLLPGDVISEVVSELVDRSLVCVHNVALDPAMQNPELRRIDEDSPFTLVRLLEGKTVMGGRQGIDRLQVPPASCARQLQQVLARARERQQKQIHQLLLDDLPF